MAQLQTLARPYAKAVFAIALENNALDAWKNFLEVVSLGLENGVVREVLLDPVKTTPEHILFLKSVLPIQVDVLQENFISLLLEEGRFFVLPAIFVLFKEYQESYNQVLTVMVKTACTLEPSEAERLRAKLEQKYQKKIQLVSEIDTTLVGGLTIQVQDKVWDSSIVGRLEQLAEVIRH